MRVLITGARAPAALHLARLLDGAGHHVVMADSLRRTVSAVSKACGAFVVLPAAADAGYGAAIKRALAEHRIDLVIPTCEEVFHLAGLWKREAMDAPLFAPDIAVLARVHSKFDFTRLMGDIGLPVPKTQLLASQQDVDALRRSARQMVFKPVWSRFATQVLIKPSDLRIKPAQDVPWVAQEHVAGDDICVYAFATKGKVGGIAAYRPVYRAGKGAGIAFDPVTDPAIEQFVTTFVAATDWTGQVAFDLIRKQDGALVALECNPRATSGVHLFRNPATFGPAFLQGGQVDPDVTALQAVKAALLLYGPFERPLGVWRDLYVAQDVMHWPGDPRPRRQQFLATCEIAGVALRRRISLAAASTCDIEWNGP